MWEEALDSDTHVQGEGSTVAKVVDGSLFNSALNGIAGVANIGTDRNWSGSHFDQANWYAFGRLSWDHQLSSRAIAEEWTRMTFANDAAFVAPVVAMMMGSRETVVNYMTPLGLHHIMATGHHYGPGPWVSNLDRPEWNPVYYHRADARGLGFDRTSSGSNAIAQYAPPVAQRFGNIETVPDDYLLWFHHVPWDRRMPSGRTLWDELVVRYSRGVDEVRAMRRTWASLEGKIDAERYAQIDAFLRIQEKEAQWWRDACLAYFHTFSQRPYPEGYAPPPHPLEYYKSIVHIYVPGRPGVTSAPFRASGAAAATNP
jgi:alpha-glucuronidase